MSVISLDKAIKKKTIFKCFDCPMKFTKIQAVYAHILEEHKDVIPDGISVKRYYFNRKYKKTKGVCVIDKKETEWNEDKGRYERFCCTACKEEARELFKKNCKRKLGTDNPASTPEHQINAIKGRSYSGVYTFKDGGTVGYSSSYEADFLAFVEEEMGYNSKDVFQCELIFEIMFNNKKAFHIPDFYIQSLNLIIQVKTFKNMNSHVQNEGKVRQKLADISIIESNNYNYIVILDKDYSNFINIVKIIKENQLSENWNGEKVICIPKY